MKNPNHPKPGSKILVHPIQNVKDIQSIKTLLAEKPRDLLLFTLGINNGIRTGDLLKLKVSDLKDLKPGDSIQITESKTKKRNTLVVNKEVHKALRHFLTTQNPKDDEYLFQSRQKGHALTVMVVNRMIKSWCKAINLPGNYGAHTLRKTFGYIQRTKFGVGFEVLCRRFNHSSPAITMRYLGITDQEVYSILQNEI
jgi:integrase